MDDFDSRVEMLDEKQNPNPKVMEHHFTKLGHYMSKVKVVFNLKKR